MSPEQCVKDVPGLYPPNRQLLVASRPSTLLGTALSVVEGPRVASRPSTLLGTALSVVEGPVDATLSP
jgi:hypothetical protein